MKPPTKGNNRFLERYNKWGQYRGKYKHSFLCNRYQIPCFLVINARLHPLDRDIHGGNSLYPEDGGKPLSTEDGGLYLTS